MEPQDITISSTVSNPPAYMFEIGGLIDSVPSKRDKVSPLPGKGMVANASHRQFLKPKWFMSIPQFAVAFEMDWLTTISDVEIMGGSSLMLTSQRRIFGEVELQGNIINSVAPGSLANKSGLGKRIQPF